MLVTNLVTTIRKRVNHKTVQFRPAFFFSFLQTDWVLWGRTCTTPLSHLSPFIYGVVIFFFFFGQTRASVK
jgi:hypothetical protein